MVNRDATRGSGVVRDGAGSQPIKSSDRVGIFGATGSGKTFLATRYLARFPNVIAADPKGTLRPGALDAIAIYRDFAALRNGYRGGRVIYRPGAFDRDVRRWDRLPWYCFQIGHVVYYVDEVYAVTGGQLQTPQGLSALVQMGREDRHAGCWLATQRPRRIGLNLISECQHYFVFHLGHPSDRALMAELTETPAVREVMPDKHGFWLYQPGASRVARYYSGLKVDEKGRA